MEPNILSSTVQAIDPNALYYTCSTIAQTLAGAFGILGAFVLFRVQSSNDKIKELATKLRDGFYPTSSPEDKEIYYEAFRKSNWSLFSDYAKKIIFPSNNSKQNIVNDLLDEFKKQLDLKKDILSYLKSAMILSAITILLSIIILPFTPLLSKCLIASVPFLITTILLTTACIISYYRLIKSAIFDKEEVQATEVQAAEKNNKKNTPTT